MDRALNRDDLSFALGELPEVPTAEELQQLLADAELALFAGRAEMPDSLVRAGWYLHAVASQAGDNLAWPRRERAFRVSAHILELAMLTERPAAERLEFAFGAELGYRRGGLDPNATAVFTQARPLLEHLDLDPESWRETLAVEAATYFLSFRTREAFAWLRTRRDHFAKLRSRTQLADLAATMFGPAEHVVEGCWALLRFLVFGDREAFAGAQAHLRRIIGEEAEPATTNERWVAAHLLGFSEELDLASVWSCLPPEVPEAARRALTSTSPPVLTLWPPQRDLLRATGETPALLSPETTRAVLSIPTSAGKTLVAQILVLAELAATDQSVCLVAPQRSLVREIRRALLPRARALRKRLSPDLPDFLADLAVGLIDEAPPDVDVMTPERFAALLRADPEQVLARYGLFVFDEAHLIGDEGRGFTLEGALTYLHWRTRDSGHRIVLMSAAIGNQATFQAWLAGDAPVAPFHSEWRGPRRLSAAYTTQVEWEQERHDHPVGQERLHRLAYPMKGLISFTVPGAGARSYVTTEPIGELVFQRTAAGGRGRKDGRSTRHYEHVAALATFLEHAGPVLIVTGTRPDAQRLARALADERDEVPSLRRARDAAVAMLDEDHPLVSILGRGVAFHHAGLPLDVLALIEDELRAGRLTHLVSTTTLTEGVNLPVHTVVLAETRWEGSDVHLSGPRMLNAIGRAGRAGIETEGWVVFAPSGAAPQDPERHLPDPEQLQIRSRLASQDMIDELVAFEGRRRIAADAVFSDLPEGLDSFTSFVWYLLACEEALSNTVIDEQLDEVIDTLFAARQVDTETIERLHRFARDVRETYVNADPARRRGWAKAGSRIRSAVRLDELGQLLAEWARARADRVAVQPAIALLQDSGVLVAALELPDVDDDVWRFRRTSRGQDVAVDLGDTLRRWTTGEPLSTMADELLGEVPDRAWRLEQLVDRVSRGFGHAVSWMIAALLERANANLVATSDEPICPNLPLYVRFGVDSPIALRLITRAVRNRDVAVRVARAAREESVEETDIDAWLGSIPVEDWPGRFGTAPSDVLDVLDAISDGQANVLRRLLDGEDVEISMVQELPPGPITLVMADAPNVALVSVRADGDDELYALAGQWQADLRTVLSTGVEIDARLTDRGSVLLHARDT
ncbi:MAG: DEAD/DEAH box helicase [Actinomycetota bacterium]|nr:DEAD/DEAH box helicase [Actinomycetota bacterium]